MRILDEQLRIAADELAINKYPYGKNDCPKSCFLNGRHRAGTLPDCSLFDGGLAGDSCMVVCLECGRVFPERWFYPKKQPSRIGEIED